MVRRIRAVAGCLNVGGTIINTLKEGRGNKDFKKGEKPSQGVGALKNGGAGTPLRTMTI